MAMHLIDQHKNDNGIQVSPLTDVGEGVVETGLTITPGAPVGKGTAAGELGNPTTNALCGGFALENNIEGAATLRTAFTAGQRVRYGRTAGAKFMGLIASGQNLVKDGYIKPAADGLTWITATVATANARITQEGGTGGALGADGHFLCTWGL